MSTKLFVGNLSFNTTENQLQDLFAAHGPVTEVDMIMDKFSGKPRGFAFITMETKEGADAAIQALHGKDMDGRALTVNEPRPQAAAVTAAAAAGGAVVNPTGINLRLLGGVASCAPGFRTLFSSSRG